MAVLSVLIILAGVAVSCGAQNNHLQSLQQPHLPRDQNVIAATQQFLQQFATLQAKAAAAPDVSVHKKVPANGRASASEAPQVFTGVLPEEPINAAIRQLHKQLKPNNNNANLLQQNNPHRPSRQPPQQQQHFRQPQHQFQQRQKQQFHHPQQIKQQQQEQQQLKHQNPPNNHFQMQLLHQPQQQQQRQVQQQQQQHQQHQQHHNPHSFTPVHNQFGHVINPNRYPGPLADDLPASVGGPLQPVGPTAAVHEAQQRLAQAHMAILAHHATLPQTPPPEKQKKA